MNKNTQRLIEASKRKESIHIEQEIDTHTCVHKSNEPFVLGLRALKLI